MCSNNSEPIARSVLTTNSKRYDSGEVIGEEILYVQGKEREKGMINFALVATICTIYHFQTCSLCSLNE